MQYLFFDIECASNDKVRGAAICSFGYVLTDEQFGVLKTEDILINPESSFQNRVLYKILSYPKESFLRSPTFPQVYPQIKELLTAKDRIIVGHAVQNDVRFLLDEQERCGIPSEPFSFVDSQKLYAPFTQKTTSVGLDEMLADLGLPPKAKKHRSDEDAMMTMLAVKVMCDRKKCDLKQLSESTPYCCGKVIDGRIQMDSPPRKPLILSEIALKNNRIGGRNLNYYFRFLAAVVPSKVVPQSLAGKSFYFDTESLADYFSETVKLIQSVVDCGGKIAKKHNADYIVAAECNNLKVIGITDLLRLLATNKEALDQTPMPNTDLNKVVRKRTAR